MEGRAPVDGWAIAAIIGKAQATVRRLARRQAIAAAPVRLAVLASRFGIRVARISGIGLPGTLIR